MASNPHEAAPPPAPEPAAAGRSGRSTRNLVLRGGSAIGVLALMYLCLWWDITRAGGWAWAALVAMGSILCLREFYRLAEGAGIGPYSFIGYVAAPAWILASEWDLSGGSVRTIDVPVALAVPVLAGMAAMLWQLTRKTNDNALVNVSLTFFGFVYCGLLPGTIIHLRHLRLAPGGWPSHGVEFVVVCIFVAKVSDVGALLIGRRWGKHKLIPRLSPGKTWEGALGGLLFSILLLQFMTWVEPRMALAQLGRGAQILLSVCLAVGGLGGDLIESAFKRDSRKKDAGAAVPGFGGVLDLLDSLMIATPVMYFFLLACGAEYVKLKW